MEAVKDSKALIGIGQSRGLRPESDTRHHAPGNLTTGLSSPPSTPWGTGRKGYLVTKRKKCLRRSVTGCVS